MGHEFIFSSENYLIIIYTAFHYHHVVIERHTISSFHPVFYLDEFDVTDFINCKLSAHIELVVGVFTTNR